ncbi:hypothetical protein GQX74_014294 [Glossina fuscipes]|nr:hypothetical protein GQX74_014294 [Glossina fuscipes]
MEERESKKQSRHRDILFRNEQKSGAFHPIASKQQPPGHNLEDIQKLTIINCSHSLSSNSNNRQNTLTNATTTTTATIPPSSSSSSLASSSSITIPNKLQQKQTAIPAPIILCSPTCTISLTNSSASIRRCGVLAGHQRTESTMNWRADLTKNQTVE